LGDPEKSQVRISPDGHWISWIAPWEGVRNVWLAPILYLKDRAGDETWCLYRAEVKSAKTRALTP